MAAYQVERLMAKPKEERSCCMQVGPARQARAYAEPSGPREKGFVARFQDTFGFIRCDYPSSTYCTCEVLVSVIPWMEQHHLSLNEFPEH